MSLSEKSDEEISSLLTEYGIKHGPIVDSTRRLYEKKLERAMESTSASPSSDKTYYREEEEVVTYVTYRTPVRSEAAGDGLKHRFNTEPDEEEDEESDQDDAEPQIQSSTRTANHTAVRPKLTASETATEKNRDKTRETVKKSGGCLWRMIRLLLVLAMLAAVFYFAYCHLINKEEGVVAPGVQ